MRNVRFVAAALVAAAVAHPSPSPLVAADFAAPLAALGAEPLAGSNGLAVEGAVAGVLSGSEGFDAARPYVLLAAAGAGREAALAAAEIVAGLELGRSVIIVLADEGRSAAGLPIEELAAVVDLSAVADGSERLVVSAVGSSDVWPRLLEQANVPVGLDLEISEAPDLAQALPVELFGRQVPGLQLASPDGASAGNDLSRAARLAALLVYKASRLAGAPDFVRAEERAAESSPAVTRIFTGTIPDYAADVEGLRLAGVMDGGPAAAAGLEAGDVIIQIGDWPIGSVYEYADTLDKLVPDETLAVVFIRDGERRETTITPRARR